MLLNNTLNYTGPYKVGCRDIEYNDEVEKAFDINQKENYSPLLMRIYFPLTQELDLESNEKEYNKENDAKANWACYPQTRYLGAFFSFMNIPNFISDRLVWFLGSPKQSSSINSGNQISNSNLLPVIIFSHGLMGNRTMYSNFVGELASYGYVVIALEHLDGTAGFSYSNTLGNQYYFHPPGQQGDELSLHFRKDKNQYINDELNLRFRQKQLNFRINEIERLLQFLNLLNLGQINPNQLASPNKNDKEQFNLLLNGEWYLGLKKFKNQLNLNEVYLIGHSFGGATVINYLSKIKESIFKKYIVLDPWLAANNNNNNNDNNNNNIPILSIISQSYSDWTINYRKTLKLLSSYRESKIVIQPGTFHFNQCDWPCLFESYFNWFLGWNYWANNALKNCAKITHFFIELKDDDKDINYDLNWSKLGFIQVENELN